MVKGDITGMAVDAIVNAANCTLLGGGGVDGAIHRKAGPGLLAECSGLGGCRTGDAKITRGYGLPAKFVIHTAGPVWGGGDKNERELLASCYRSCLDIARQRALKTIVFPSISTGAYRFPIALAAPIALNTVKTFLTENPGCLDKVVFALFSDSDLKTYQDAYQELCK